MSDRIAIVGSGPSGIAAAYNLIERGMKVTLLDVGLTMDQEGLSLKKAYLTQNQSSLIPQIHKKRMTAAVTGQKGIPTKMPFASNFVYRHIPGTDLDRHGSIPTISFAVGGLSQAWGANVSLISEKDTQDWPIKVADFESSFKKLRNIVDMSGENDDIDKNFPTSLSSDHNFPLGLQGQRILNLIRENQESLSSSGLRCGRSKLAVGRKYSLNQAGCVSCSLCMHGCAYKAIFNSEDVLSELKKNSNFQYIPNAVVHRFEETKDRVVVDWHWLDSNETERREFERLLIGAGVFNSSALVSRSLKFQDSTFRIKDSQKYLFPFLSLQRSQGALTSPANSLAQIYLQSHSLKSSGNIVHGQLYGYNDLILDPLRPLLGSLVDKLPLMMPWFFERLMIGMIYLHSNDSGYLDFQVNPNHQEALGKVTGHRSSKGDLVAGEFIDLINSNSRFLGGKIPKFLVQKNQVGGGLHYGSSMPMSLVSSQKTTDIQGRPYGCHRTHIIDSSVLPSIPGTPTTYTVMANAIRISDEIINNLKKGG